ncbi:phosphate regulon sensor histidine kinase PhoR [Nitrosomonas sp. Nm166]|uniref:phosphate regulon sensor histidine kinase PhoR n=1 Tax=Nitrosomonas sp. Nm166 TaxID=1881054 RepID=UPI0008E1EA9C|nr:phosphate regulon sensor histidine kinase PhoR [Nitrosomonas sp. Nm166]SFE09495.1 two-component system, OmpR family, phosphate regulon sensor histidine kinase PhoR [Nitrosomonas sp. Nm166]
MFDIWQRCSNLLLVIFITAIIWMILGAVKALIFFSIVLLWMVFHHIRHLVALERWLQRSDHSVASIPPGTGAWNDVFAHLARYVRQYSHSQELLSLALERMRSVTSAMPDGIVLLDEADRIEWCNLVAEQHLGINLSLDAGQQITYLVRQIPFVEYLTARKYSDHLTLKQPRQQGLIISLQLVPYGYNQKLLISRDITRFEKIETMRRDFIANVSHELRTPLTVIGGFLETLSADENVNTGFNKRVLALMTEQTTRMQRLIEDLLILSRLENEQNKINEKIVDVVSLLHVILQDAESLSAGRHRIKLNIATQDQLLGSEEELRSAFGNLISNAIRYTPDKGEINISWEKYDGQGLFFVQDSGIGIEPEHIPRLTERFYRVDNSRSRETGGTGLGLAIVKHVLSRHEARLEIISQVGKGSRFNIWFPAKRLIALNK